LLLLQKIAIIEKEFFFLNMWAERPYLFPLYKAIFKRQGELKSEFSMDNSESFWKQ